MIEKKIAETSAYNGPIVHNQRPEYGNFYRDLAAVQKMIRSPAKVVDSGQSPPAREKAEILILGNAGQRIGTAGELLALAGMAGGFQATQKNNHDITVLRGAAMCDVILWPERIGFAGIERPQVILALGQEGVNRRKNLFACLLPDSLVIKVREVDIPLCQAEIFTADFKQASIREQDWALAALALLAAWNRLINLPMLQSALEQRFRGAFLASALKLIASVDEKLLSAAG